MSLLNNKCFVMKRISVYILACSLLVSIISFNTNGIEVASAASIPNAYKEIIKDWTLIEKIDSNDTDYLKNYFGTVYGFDSYFLYDLNKDKTPELFLYSKKMGLTAVLTVKSGKPVYLMCNDFYKINTTKKTLVVWGHWHGAGGTGKYEYSGYKISKGKMKSVFYIDRNFSIYNPENDGFILKKYYTNMNAKEYYTKSKYQSVLKDYEQKGKKITSFKLNKLK